MEMHEVPRSNTPRWGNHARDYKARAIWRTLERHCGSAIFDGAWLDVGCGSGGIASTLSAKVRYVTGVDPEPWEAWNEARALHSNLSFVTGTFDGEIPPVPDVSFDIAVCNQVYEHVGDPVALLRNIHRALVPGGVCYFAGPNLLWPIEPHVFWPFVHWLPRSMAHRVMRWLGSRRAHELDAYSVAYCRLVSWFQAAGFAYENAVVTRLFAGLDEAPGARIAAAMQRVPQWMVGALAPLAPGFVFILRRSDETAGAGKPVRSSMAPRIGTMDP